MIRYLPESSHHFLERHVYSELECGAEEGRTRTGSWPRLNGQLLPMTRCSKPAPHFLFPVRSHGYVMPLHTSEVSAAADLAVAV